jgi:hypothetical protein
MPTTIATSVEIAAPIERVWSFLSDLPGWSRWNPFCTVTEGTLGPDARLKVVIRPEGMGPQTFAPRIVRLDPGRGFAWRGSLPIPGLFVGTHGYDLTDLGGGRTRLDHREDFTGILVGLVMRRMGEPTRKGFEAMNAALKAEAERG